MAKNKELASSSHSRNRAKVAKMARVDTQTDKTVRIARKLFQKRDATIVFADDPPSHITQEKTRNAPEVIGESVWQVNKNPTVEFRVITAEEYEAEIDQERSRTKSALDEYYRTHLEADERGRWKNRLPKIETGRDFSLAVGAAAVVEGPVALSGDKLGIFRTNDELASQRMGQFFEGFMKATVNLTRKIHDSLYNNQGFVSRVWEERQGNLTRDEIMALRYSLQQSENQNGKAPTQEQVTNFLALSNLVTEFMGMLDLTPEEKGKHLGLPYKERSYHTRKYKFSTPATVHFEIDNVQTGRVIEMTIFGLPYVRYEGPGTQGLADVLPEEAKEIMHERRRDLRFAEDIAEILEKAGGTLKKPHLEFSLFPLTGMDNDEPEKILVSRIRGELLENPVGDEIESSLVLAAEGFPGITTTYSFDRRPKSLVTKTEEDAKLPLQKIAEGFARLSIA